MPLAHRKRQRDRKVPAQAAERHGSPSSRSILIGAIFAEFGLLAVGIGQVKNGIRQVRIEVQANSDRVDAVDECVSENSYCLIRVETLLEERLPERRQRERPRS